MSKRLQVILQDSEYREILRIARSRGLSLSEWVRHSLALARRNESLGNSGKKLAIIRAAARHEYPTADIGQILEEIESGYLTPPAV